MADVINFEDRLARAPRRLAENPREGKILIFTGVRYERWTAGGDDQTQSAGQKRPVRRAGGKAKKH